MRNLIRKVLKEALGVPEGILESGEQLYELINNRLKKIPKEIPEENNFEISTKIKISDYVIKKVYLNLNIKKIDTVSEVDFYSMGFNNVSRFNNKTFKLINIITPDTVELSINLACPENVKKKDIIDYFKKDKVNILSALTHELGHAFNIYKKEESTVKSMAKYRSYHDTNFPIKPISEFIHMLYYIHAIENIVRPIEVASKMRSEDINKEKFYEFITNNETYKKLKKINGFSYQNFRDELKNDAKNIKNFLDRIGADVSQLNTDDEIVDEVLRILFINLVNKTLDVSTRMITSSPIEEIFGFQGKKLKFFQKLVSSFSKYENNINKFFEDEEKNFKFISEKMLKKISKLYDMAKTKNSSIRNWDLHHKINKSGEQFETKLRYGKK